MGGMLYQLRGLPFLFQGSPREEDSIHAEIPIGRFGLCRQVLARAELPLPSFFDRVLLLAVQSPACLSYLMLECLAVARG